MRDSRPAAEGVGPRVGGAGAGVQARTPVLGEGGRCHRTSVPPSAWRSVERRGAGPACGGPPQAGRGAGGPCHAAGPLVRGPGGPCDIPGQILHEAARCAGGGVRPNGVTSHL